MELKKSPQANLESKRNVFVLIGLIISISMCLYGFESTSEVNKIDTFGQRTESSIEEELTPLVRLEEVKPILPPPPKVVDLLVIVDNNTEISEELEILDSEADAQTAITAVMQVTQSKEIDVEDNTIFISVEEKPEFPGGDRALLNFLNLNVKYPTVAQENGIKGTVTVSFVVNKDGSVTDARILRSVDQSLDKEALRVVNCLPKWKPGKQGGKPVRVSFSVPINFKLQ